MDQGGDDTDALTAAVLALSRKGLAATTIGVYEVVRDPDAAKLLTKKFDTYNCTVLVRGGGKCWLRYTHTGYDDGLLVPVEALAGR